MTSSELDLEKVREAILHYLQNNPNAADSLDGVINWWLPQAYRKVEVVRIEQVLEQLIADGLVRKIALMDGTNLYGKSEVETCRLSS